MIKIKLREDNYFCDVLNCLLQKDKIQLHNKLLVIGGSSFDKEQLLKLNFTNVTITNIDDNIDETTYHPFLYEFQDAEHLTYNNCSFDIVISSHCIHHCRSPHRALAEMLRVSSRFVLVFEGKDSFLSRLGLLFGTSEEYELFSVKDHNFISGGTNNTFIPNYVYRWSENEIIKIVKSFQPEMREDVIFFYSLELNYYISKLKY